MSQDVVGNISPTNTVIVDNNPIHLNPYIIDLSPEDVANALPPPVNELERRSAVNGLDAMGCKQKGFHCPRCFSTNTQFVGNQKPTKKRLLQILLGNAMLPR